MLHDCYIILRSSGILKRRGVSKLAMVCVNDYIIDYIFTCGEKLSTCGSIKKVVTELPLERFIQISRSKVVNADHVVEVDLKNRRLKLSDGSWHIISTRRLRGVLNFLSNR